MKKISIGMLLLFISAFCFLGFKKKISTPAQPTTTTLNGVNKQAALDMIQNFATYSGKDIRVKSLSAFYRVDQIRVINQALTNQNADGLRIYFGSGTPVPPSSTKIKADILLVATKPRPGGGTATLSAHADYYVPAGAGGLSTTEIGTANNEHGDQVRDWGGSLYNTKPPLVCLCAKPSGHLLPGGEAYLWVQDRYENGGKDKMPYNTKSEWFSYPFINALFNVLTDPNNPFTGLRIYVGKGFKDSQGNIRDVFILVPTTSVGKLDADYYCCLEDLSKTPFPNEKHIKVPAYKRFPFDSTGGGYDIGELCPSICN
jgi:hypothetical protein